MRYRTIVALLLALVVTVLLGAGRGAAQGTDRHRIAIRQVDGIAEFYNVATGERFVPRGVNYFYIVPVDGGFEDRVFGVDEYDAGRVRADFAALAGNGYNTVRIFLDTCGSGPGCIGSATGSGLNGVYLDNIAEVMRIARDEGLFLLLTSNDLPDQGGYWELSNRGANRFFEGYRNAHYLTSYGVLAATRYWGDLLDGLAARGAPFEVVLGWSLLNEQWYFNDQPPLSLTSGSVTTANERTYRLDDPAQKRRMLVEGIVHYIDEVRAVIKRADPDALITMGFFHPDNPNPARIGDFRYVDTAPLLNLAALDFFDFHAYPGVELSLPQYVENFGMTGYESKPVIMGEVGAFLASYPSVESAARAMQTWIAESCEYGFDGWLYWGFYRAPEAIGDASWGLVDENGVLMSALAPANQPDPCDPVPLDTGNVAYGQPVTASRALPDEPPENAVDGGPAQWGAGQHPPQWITITLPPDVPLGEVRLRVAQWPAGETLHRVWALRGDLEILIAEFREFTSEGDLLEATLPVGLDGIGALRVETLESPSWVSWQEIEVLSGLEAAAGACVIISPGNTNLRTGPGTDFEAVGRLTAGRGAIVTGQRTGADGFVWWQVPPGVWVRSDVVRPTGGCEGVPTVAEPALPAEFDRLMAEPLLSDAGSTAHRIFVQGLAQGNDPTAFTKVGDCNTHYSFFLTGFDQGLYDLGPYDRLQPTVEFFAGWFGHESLAGQVGFNALTMLESLWVDPSLCAPQAGEGPLACEYARTQASVAVMMFGPNDMLNLDDAQFTQAVRDVIELSIERGVIPVLTTFTWHEDQMWERALRYNVILVDLAEEYDIPLINFWRAARDLPNLGLVTDYTHLTAGQSGDHPATIAFTGEETQSGHALRNLLTLQMLDLLRREVIEPGLAANQPQGQDEPGVRACPGCDDGEPPHS